MHALSELYESVVSGSWKGSMVFHGDEQEYRAAQLKQKIDVIKDLLDSYNVGFSEKVIVNAGAGVYFVATMLALWNRGAVLVPLKDMENKSAVKKIANDCNAKYLMDGVSIEKLPLKESQEVTFIEVKTKRTVTAVDLALIIYSSGSTGTPKGIQLTHGNMLSALNAISGYLTIHEEERILCLSPFSFDYGLYQLLFSLYCHCHLSYFDGLLHPSGLVKLINDQKITLLPLVPVVANLLNRAIVKSTPEMPSLKKVTNTGGHLNVGYIKNILHSYSNIQVFTMYGLTESKRAMYLDPKLAKEKLGSVGKPMPGLEAKIFSLNQSGIWQEVETGETGELFVRGASVMQGYTHEVKSGARLIAGDYRDDNWLATGDLFRQDKEGFFFFVGRAKDLIKQAGYCLYPSDLEAEIQVLSGVDICLVVPDEDQNNQEIAHLVIVKSDEAEQEDILIDIKQAVHKDYIPRKISFVERIQYTPNGKIDKNSVLEQLKS